MYKLTDAKYKMIASYIESTDTPERMAKIAKRLMQMLKEGEISWVEYEGLLTYRRINEINHGYGAKVIKLMNA